MKCPKCGYHSFEYLDSCKKCGEDLAEHKHKFNLHGFISPGQPAVAAPDPVVDQDVNQDIEEEEAPADGPIDFGFDFLDEEPAVGEPAKKISLGGDDQDVSIDQPFGADSETIPAETRPEEGDDEAGDKPEKGPEFAF